MGKERPGECSVMYVESGSGAYLGDKYGKSGSREQHLEVLPCFPVLCKLINVFLGVVCELYACAL